MHGTANRTTRRAGAAAARLQRASALVAALSLLLAAILPAAAFSDTDPTYCGFEAHTHTEECIQKTLICGMEESDGHTHTPECYAEQQVLTCALAEHTHSAEAGCYDENGELICTLPAHTHGESCYTAQEVLICGQEESEGHHHTDACYELTYICGYAQEHTHTLACYSNPDADLETAEDWEQTFAEVALTGNYPADALAIAQTQLGYAESTHNFLVMDDGVTAKGYTRYGAWYGDPYGDWCAMFVSFCLHYAGIPAEKFPRDALCPRWVQTLQGSGLYAPADGYTPTAGEPVFFDLDADGEADHVGLVSEVSDERITAIEGNSDDRVQSVTYVRGSPAILGYGTLSAVAAYLPVAAADGSEYMGLVMYYCSYDGNEPNIGGYTRHQLVPGRISGYEQVFGENIEQVGSSPYRFKIRGAYTDGTDYLIPVSYFETVFRSRGYTFNPVNTGTSPFIFGGGAIFSTDSGGNNRYNADNLYASDYYCLNGNWYVRIKAAPVDSAGSYMIGVVYYAVMETASDTVNPNSTVINLFDYWAAGERHDSDNHASTTADLTSGINAEHLLKFGRNISSSVYGKMNYSYGSTATPSKVTQGIVANLLGDDRYPRLSGDTSLMPAGVTQEQATESLAYLFDPELEVPGKVSFSNVTGLLWQSAAGYYCFDSQQRAADLDEQTHAITEYLTPAGVYTGDSNINGQFFPFNDSHRTALLNADRDPMNHYFGMSMTARFIQQYGGKTSKTSDEDVTFTFSGDNDVWIFIDNVLVADLGGLGSAASVTINFHTGEVLINDTGTTGNPTGTPSTTIREMFIAANEGYATSIAWNGDTLPDDTMHTLKFYYLERGNFDSNLMLTYNLNQVPISSLYKVDQYGSGISGARFAVYAADEEYNYIGVDGTPYSSSDVAGFTIDSRSGNISSGGAVVIKPAYSGVTEDGAMLFMNDDDMPYSLEELEAMFGSRFILREVEVPAGYRTVSDEIRLTIEGGVMLCDNTYDSGVWASTSALVTATNQLYIAREYADIAANLGEYALHVGDQEVVDGPSGETRIIPIYSVDYYSAAGNTRNGTLFSVVLKRNGRDFWRGFGYDYWYPVYGSDATGYTVVEAGVPAEPEDWTPITFDNAPTNIDAVLTAAKAQAALLGEDALVFRESGNGMQLLNENLPGKINRYYSWMLSNGKLDASNPSDADPQYVVAYYWTTAGSVEEATADNTVRVYSHNNIISNVDGMRLQWSTSISVPNMENRLYFQKLSGDSENMTTDPIFIEDAVFALYCVGEDAAGNIYYIADDGTRIYLAPDGDCDNVGTARVGGSTGTYRVSELWQKTTEKGLITGSAGVITVFAGGKRYTISPAKNALGDTMAGYTHDSCGFLDLKGTAWDTRVTSTGHFTALLNGAYVLREICAPTGYLLSNEQIMVLVNDDGVFANAGTKGNGVMVGNGPGYISSTLDLFASEGMIDETLTWIYTQLEINKSTTFADFEAAESSEASWQFALPDGKTADGIASGSEATTDRSAAMVTYLTYLQSNTVIPEGGSRAIFNYGPTAGADGTGQSARTPSGASGIATTTGEGTLRLYTDEGWSKLGIYQDHAYGWDQITQREYRNTNYDDLTGRNLTNLFSNSTFIRVADSAVTDLTVRKVDADEPQKLLSGAQFVLYRTLAGGEKLYYSRTADSGTQWVAGGDAADFALTTGASGLALFKHLPDGVYTLQELAAPDSYRCLTEPITLTIDHAAGVQAVCGDLALELTTDPDTLACTLAVPNYFIVELPHTGGAGTTLYTIVGLLLIAASAGVFEYKHKFKKS